MEYKYLKEINSTNTYCKENMDTIFDKTVVYTYNQTQGRGRFNRSWINLGEENLFLSIVLKPSDKIKEPYSNLTQYTSLALSKTFEGYNVKPTIKWPNDILINNKKISGILAEAVVKENLLKGIIIGVGINLNAKEADFTQIDKKVTSLNLETGKDINKNSFLKNFTKHFFENYETFINTGFSTIKDEYQRYITFIGKEVSINNLNETITGTAQEITTDGAIVINNKKYFTGDIL